jgi:hypothetical protein
MSKFKFKINQRVYLKNEDHSSLMISDRKIENGKVVYELRKLNYWHIYAYNKIDNFIKDYICNPLNKLKLYKLSHIFWWIFIHKKTYTKGDIWYTGLRNYPRTDNYIQEERLLEREIYIPPILCSYNGCELVNEFLSVN